MMSCLKRVKIMTNSPAITFICLPVAAYLLGAIPWGVVLTRLFTRIDIRKQGSGNIGATNVSRVAGPVFGLLTFIGDVLKGAVPVLLGFILAEDYHRSPAGWLPAITALAAFLGHLYPLFMKFKGGGKGVATCAGCYLVLAPAACLSALLAFVIALFASKRVSAASLAAAAVLPCAAWFFTESVQITAVAVIMAILIFIRHTDNIKRLIAGTEPKFKDRSRD
jgi:glycerol-3-phosphate acyltransferase PlsY